MHPAEHADLARKAVFVGAVLTAAVVFFALLSAVWGPESAPEANAVPTHLGSATPRGGELTFSAGSESDDEPGGDDSDSEDKSKEDKSKEEKSGSGKSESGGTEDKDEKAGAGTGSGSDGVPASRSSSTPSTSAPSGASAWPKASGTAAPGKRLMPTFGPRPSAAPPSGLPSGSAERSGSTASPDQARSHTSKPLACTIVVADQASMSRAMAAVGPDEVICVRGGVSGPPSTRGSIPPLSGGAPGASSSASPSPPSAGRSGDAEKAGDAEKSGTGGSGGGSVDPAGTATVGPGSPDQGNCTQEITDGPSLEKAIDTAKPGDKICVTADDVGIRLEISKGGSAGSPIQIVGNGRTATKGISVEADHVVVDGFTADRPEAPGIEITGNGVTVRNNTITKPVGGDGDGLRFFGNDINILNNSIGQTGDCGGCHADCMQTFTSGRPSSENVRIEGNKCEKIANICLMAEGPGDVGDGGGGDGTSANWTLSNNSCEFGAAQGYMIEAVQNVTMTDNEFIGEADKAIGLDIGSTGAKVAGNKLIGIENEVGMDSSSKEGYEGPDPGTGP